VRFMAEPVAFSAAALRTVSLLTADCTVFTLLTRSTSGALTTETV
jgi:hypothetical protein